MWCLVLGLFLFVFEEEIMYIYIENLYCNITYNLILSKEFLEIFGKN